MTISLKNQFIMIIVGLFMIHNFFGIVREVIPKDILTDEEITSIDEKKDQTTLPTGFAQYKWGDSKSKLPDLQVTNKLNDNRVVYQVKNPKLLLPVNLIGTNKPSKIYVMFANDKLSYAVFQLSENAYDSTINFMTKRFGKPSKSLSKEGTTLKWEDNKTVIFLKPPQKGSFFVQTIEKNYHKKYH